MGIRNALVLSGGGAKGAFQVGAIKRFVEKGIEFDIVAGVSVGSLNGAMVAQGKFKELFDVWNSVCNDSVYEKYSNFWAAVRVLILGERGIYDAEPLYKLLEENVKKKDFKKKFFMGVTSLDTGNYYSLTVDDLVTDKDVRDAIFASSLMPIIWAPVEVRTRSGVITNAVDGGLRNVTPLADVIQEFPDHIYIVSCSRGGGRVDPASPKSVIDIAKRTFTEIMISEVVDTDIKDLLRINALVLQARDKGFVLYHPVTGREYKYFDVTLIEAPHNLGDPIEFNQETIQRNIALGYEMAK